MMKSLTPIILAIETSTSACSVALGVGDEQVFERLLVGNNVHSQVLLTMVQEVFAEAALSVNELNAVAVGHGPGSFTGLRIGIGVAQGIAYGAKCPMLGASSLSALALQSNRKGIAISAIDARMGEVYWGCYENDTIDGDSKEVMPRLCGEMLVSKPEKITRHRVESLLAPELVNEPFFLVGNAWSAYQDQFELGLLSGEVLLEDCIYPQAIEVLRLSLQNYRMGNTIAPTDFVAQYVRNDVAKKKQA